MLYCCLTGSVLGSYGWLFKGFLKGPMPFLSAVKPEVIDHNYRPFPQIVKPLSLKEHNKHISFLKSLRFNFDWFARKADLLLLALALPTRTRIMTWNSCLPALDVSQDPRPGLDQCLGCKFTLLQLVIPKSWTLCQNQTSVWTYIGVSAYKWILFYILN